MSIEIIKEMFKGRSVFDKGGSSLEPWYVKESINFLETVLTKDMNGFEWGGGMSSIWIAKRIKHLTTVENVVNWIKRIRRAKKEFNVTNLNVIQKERNSKEYPNAINKFPDNHFDCIFVDAHQRVQCINNAIKKLKPGGYLILDDAYWVTLIEVLKKLKDWETNVFELNLEHEYKGHKYSKMDTRIYKKPN